LMLSHVSVELSVGDDHVAIRAVVEVVDRTGVEMEALTACSVAALTVYDMCKAIDRDMAITDLVLDEKSGGRSGDYRRA
ncbi:MAG: cyclic pyranopterin monophosphate synthase MoaC, partial [Actinobacteria bacterium]|nr:cyclic pyranopterin monophosphate synthase MoaC [Actinomycetota bacterium]